MLKSELAESGWNDRKYLGALRGGLLHTVCESNS